MEEKEKLDIREKGGVRNGERQYLDTRLFMQLLAFGDGLDTPALVRALQASGAARPRRTSRRDSDGAECLNRRQRRHFFVWEVIGARNTTKVPGGD